MHLVIGWLLSFLPILAPVLKRFLPKTVISVAGMAGRGGLIGGIALILSKIMGAVQSIHVYLLGALKGRGRFAFVFLVIEWVCVHLVKFPTLFFLVFVLGQYFPTIFEKIFLIIGAFSIKIFMVVFRWARDFISSIPENNIEELREALGTSAQNLPPCVVDVLGYMHIVEDIGMIVTTFIFIIITKLIIYFAFGVTSRALVKV